MINWATASTGKEYAVSYHYRALNANPTCVLIKMICTGIPSLQTIRSKTVKQIEKCITPDIQVLIES